MNNKTLRFYLAVCLFLTACHFNTLSPGLQDSSIARQIGADPIIRLRALATSPESDGLIKIITQTLESPSGGVFAIARTELDNYSAIYTNTVFITNTSKQIHIKDSVKPMLKPLESFEPHIWSLDGDRLYVAKLTGPGRCANLATAQGILVVDAKTGQISQLDLPKTGRGFSVSPNESFVAYFQMDMIVLLNTANQVTNTLLGSDRVISTASEVGSIRWNSTSDSFAFSVVYAPCDSPEAYQVYVYSNEKGFRKVLSSSMPYAVENFVSSESIILRAADGSLWRLALTSGQLQQMGGR